MKTLFTLIAFLVAFTTFSYAQDPEALKAMKIGKFTYQGEEGKVIITRTETQQIEVYNDGKSKGVLDIVWVNDSEYILTLKSSENAQGCMRKGDKIRTKILTCQGNKYYYESTCVTCGTDSNTIVKID